MTGGMTLFGASHLGVLGATLGSCCLAVWLGRGVGVGRWVGWVLAGVLVAGKGAGLWLSGRYVGLSWEGSLPMHLCDWAWFCVVVALVWRRQGFYELAYYWGLAGTFQAVLTPDLAYDFPHPLFLTFFISHCGLLVGVVFLTLGAGMLPGRGGVWRAFGWANVYAVVASLLNAALGANYGYLCEKPAHASLMDYLGPWPWYVVSLEALALALFAILDLPFLAGRRRAGASGGT